MLRSTYALDTWKCIYPKQAYSAVGGGFERDFMRDIIEPSADIVSFSKLDKRHALKIPYRDEHGILREYEVDFLIKTKDSIYLVETKGDRDMEKATVAVKARAARRWCETASGVKPPIEQPEQWEYLLMSESLFKQNRHLSFAPFIPLCRSLRDHVIKNYEDSTKS